MSPSPWSVRRMFVRLRWLTLLALALAGPALPPPATRAAAHFTVDVAGDLAPAAANGSCYDAGAGGCTLREAIQEANSDGSATIDFAAGLAGATITLASGLGGLRVSADAITIDGSTRGITVSGASLAADQSVFVLQGNRDELRNLIVRAAPRDGVAIGDFDLGIGAANHISVHGLTITGSGRAGVFVSGGGAGGNGATIRDSLIGAASYSTDACSAAAANSYGILTDPGVVGTQIVLNTIICNRDDGIRIDGAGSAASLVRTNILHNTIGSNGTIALGNGAAGVAITGGARRIDLYSNLISGNGQSGIAIAGAATNDITIGESLIGTSQSGDAAIPNAWDGIAIDGLANANIMIGGFNHISGNGRSGVLLHNSSYVTVRNNGIGTNFFGTAALGNGAHGIAIDGSSTFNTVSGTDRDDRNVISGNALDGVAISGAGATDNLIDDNLIGLSAYGNVAIPNGGHGVAISGADNNHIGSWGWLKDQFISGNGGAGISVENASGTVIGQTSAIGIASNGFSPLGNQKAGVLLNNTSNTGVFAVVVSYNGGAGVALSGDSSAGNMILPFIIEHNGGLPIDLGDDGPTRNDPGDGDSGPNTLLNYPEITSMDGKAIAGTACGGCTVVIYGAGSDTDAPGGGGGYPTRITAAADGRWSTILEEGRDIWAISLVACAAPCSSASNTSEMSPRPRLHIFMPLLRR